MAKGGLMITSNVFDAYEIGFSNGEHTTLIAKGEEQARQIIKILLPSASIETISVISHDSAIAV